MFKLTTQRTIMATVGVTTSLASGLALAHVGADSAPHAHGLNALSSFVQGAVHPLTGLDHLAAMVSVGLWSAIGLTRSSNALTPSSNALWRAPAAFATALLVGAILGMAGLNLPGVEPMIAASVLILGLLVAVRAHWSIAQASMLVAAFALFHGLAHGQELGGHPAAALLGMVTSTALLHAGGMAAGLALQLDQHPARRWLSRLAGASTALLGLSLLTPALAQAWR